MVNRLPSTGIENTVSIHFHSRRIVRRQDLERDRDRSSRSARCDPFARDRSNAAHESQAASGATNGHFAERAQDATPRAYNTAYITRCVTKVAQLGRWSASHWRPGTDRGGCIYVGYQSDNARRPWSRDNATHRRCLRAALPWYSDGPPAACTRPRCIRRATCPSVIFFFFRVPSKVHSKVLFQPHLP